MAGTREQRLEVLDHRRHHELVTVHFEEIEQASAERLDPTGLRGENVLDVLGQYPDGHRQQEFG